MSLQPLKPKSPQRIGWEQNVCHHIEIEAELTTSDAQGLMEAQAGTVDSLYLLRTVPMIAAMRLLRDSEPAPTLNLTATVHTAEPAFTEPKPAAEPSPAYFSVEPVRAATWHGWRVETASGNTFADAAGPYERDRLIACVNACAGITTDDLVNDIGSILESEARVRAQAEKRAKALTDAMQRNVAGLALARRVRAMLKGAKFFDGTRCMVLTSDAEEVEGALKVLETLYEGSAL